MNELAVGQLVVLISENARVSNINIKLFLETAGVPK